MTHGPRINSICEVRQGIDNCLKTDDCYWQVIPPNGGRCRTYEVGWDSCFSLKSSTTSCVSSGDLNLAVEVPEPHDVTTCADFTTPMGCRVNAPLFGLDCEWRPNRRPSCIPRAVCGAARKRPPAAPVRTARTRLWLMDTGCGHDIVCKSGVDDKLAASIRAASTPLAFETANGALDASEEVPMMVPALDGQDAIIEPYVLPDSPDVLSIGKRCVDHGYGFYWPPYLSLIHI